MYHFELWFSLSICPVVGLLDHMVVLFLVFKGTSILFSIVVVSFTFSPTLQEGSLFSTPSPAFIVCRIFDDGHSDRCEVIPHCGFDLHFFINLFIFILLFIYGCVGSSFLYEGFLQLQQAGGHSSSQCTGLSLSRPLLLQSTGSRRAGSAVVAHGPSRSAACGIFPDRGTNPCALHWQADS